MTFETILLDKQDGVGLITLNRPEALNALNVKLLSELGDALLSLDSDDDIGRANQAQTACKRGAIDGGDNRFLTVEDLFQYIGVGHGLAAAIDGLARWTLEVGAGTKCRAITSNDDTSHLIILVCRDQVGIQLVDEFGG